MRRWVGDLMIENYYVRRHDESGRAVDYEPFNRPYQAADFIIFSNNISWLVKDGETGEILGEFSSLNDALDYVNAQGVELLIIVKGAKRSDADPAKLLDNNSYVFTADAPGPFPDKTAAKAMAGAKHIWVQSDEPTALEVGDIWIQTE